ncbi:MAG: aldehyde dehydrogenase [Lachnospira sp.]
MEIEYMTADEIKILVDRQREYFLTGETLNVKFRLDNLRHLRDVIIKYENEIYEAIKSDLGKSRFESYMCEVGLTLSEITYMLKHTKHFSKEKRVRTPLAQFHSRSFKKPSPYGVTLIMSPWNYPFLLTMEPLVDALAAGNTAVIKPSAYSPATSDVMAKIVKEAFDSKYVAVVTGGRAENTCLLNEHFDYIFFTGSQAVGREVMSHAARYLTPVTLELGGKSPCIVTEHANIKLAAKRIVFGKYLNCGQTCVAPDYIYVHEKVKDEFVSAVKDELQRQYGSDVFTEPFKNADYGKIINEKHLDRLTKLIDKDKVVAGGFVNKETCQFAPTVMDNVTFEDAVMQEEIFGPIMPVLTFKNLESAVEKINSMQHPLALYIFTDDKRESGYVTAHCGYGGGCINDTIIHLATSNMGFGGFGESGMGSYHGKDGFDTFSHYKSIVDKKTWLDLPMRYQPYKSINDKLIHMFLK